MKIGRKTCASSSRYCIQVPSSSSGWLARDLEAHDMLCLGIVEIVFPYMSNMKTITSTYLDIS